MRFSQDEYLKSIEIAVDGASPSINRFIVTKASTVDSERFYQTTIGSLRSKKDKSVKTSVEETVDAQFKAYGIVGWSM